MLESDIPPDTTLDDAMFVDMAALAALPVLIKLMPNFSTDKYGQVVLAEYAYRVGVAMLRARKATRSALAAAIQGEPAESG